MTERPSRIADAWLSGPRDDASTYQAMREIRDSAELLEDLLDDCLTVLDLACDGDAAEFAMAEAEWIRSECAS